MFFHKNNPEKIFNGLEFKAVSEYRWACWSPAFVGYFTAIVNKPRSSKRAEINGFEKLS